MGSSGDMEMILVIGTQNLITKQLKRWVHIAGCVLSEATGHGTEAEPTDPNRGRQDSGGEGGTAAYSLSSDLRDDQGQIFTVASPVPCIMPGT